MAKKPDTAYGFCDSPAIAKKLRTIWSNGLTPALVNTTCRLCSADLRWDHRKFLVCDRCDEPIEPLPEVVTPDA